MTYQKMSTEQSHWDYFITVYVNLKSALLGTLAFSHEWFIGYQLFIVPPFGWNKS
jgi:hypothetical protein